MVGTRIKKARELLGLSQTEFGARIGILTQAAISRWERGEREPDAEVLQRISAVTKLPVAWFLQGSHPDVQVRERDFTGREGYFAKACQRAVDLDLSDHFKLITEEQDESTATAFLQTQVLLSSVLGLVIEAVPPILVRILNDQEPYLTWDELYDVYGRLLAGHDVFGREDHTRLLVENRKARAEVRELRADVAALTALVHDLAANIKVKEDTDAAASAAMRKGDN